jgi:hypothetical protein
MHQPHQAAAADAALRHLRGTLHPLRTVNGLTPPSERDGLAGPAGRALPS